MLKFLHIMETVTGTLFFLNFEMVTREGSLVFELVVERPVLLHHMEFVVTVRFLRG